MRRHSSDEYKKEKKYVFVLTENKIRKNKTIKKTSKIYMQKLSVFYFFIYFNFWRRALRTLRRSPVAQALPDKIPVNMIYCNKNIKLRKNY